MADQKINELPTKTAPSTGDKMLMIGTAEEYQIDYDQLATAILNKLSTQSFSSLDTTSKTVLGAIDELNSKSWEISYNELKENDNLNNKSKSGFYRITDDLKAKTIINNPVTGINSCSFTMMVLCIQPEHYSTQILVPYANDIDKIYVRKMVNDKWGTWKSFSFS